jgi:NADH-quinone oxidoreductase subunit N
MLFLQQAGAAAVLPEIVLAVLAMALLMFGAFRRGESADAVTTGSVFALAIVSILVMYGGNGQAFGGAFVVDSFARVMKLFTLFGAAVSIVLSLQYLKRIRMARFEYPVLVLLAACGMLMMISANSMIALYVGLELQSLALYVVAAIDRDNARSSEAGLKYFVLGSLSSGMLLYGASLVYGFTGSVQFPVIAEVIAKSGVSLGVIFGIVFVIAGLAFKISAVPFHMWTPDVYEGAPTPVTAFFASAPKLAAMALLTRVMMSPFGPATHHWQQIIVFVAIASMALSAFGAIGQTNIKRLLGYSSIGHMGYALVGLAAGTQQGVSGVAIYMLIYILTTLGTFACIMVMRRDGRPVETISDLAGLSRNDKGMAFVFAMLMFSLAGLPPLAGFFGKLFVFMAAVKAGLYGLAILGVLASVVGAYYYVRIVKMIYFDEPAAAFDRPDTEVKVVAYAGGLFALLFVFYAWPLLSLADAAAKSFP